MLTSVSYMNRSTQATDSRNIASSHCPRRRRRKLDDTIRRHGRRGSRHLSHLRLRMYLQTETCPDRFSCTHFIRPQTAAAASSTPQNQTHNPVKITDQGTYFRPSENFTQRRRDDVRHR